MSIHFSRIFALELLENGGENPGVSKIYFGGGPYSYINWVQNDFMVRDLTYTPLLINPKRRDEYFVDLRSIKVHGFTVPINKKLLSINKKTGIGGTKVDILIPYTTLETSIYKAFIQTHFEWAGKWNIQNGIWMDHPVNISRVAPVSPFTACYNSSTLPRVSAFSGDYLSGASVALIFPKSVWNISLFDLVRVNEGVDCVGVLDGGSNPTTSIVIGARQISFLEFDISRSRLGFVEPNLHESSF
ncbi:basic 7S globulin-like [Papaver somniferum]|uniref:basic 7S globulin-like n=1 Tax=Papaver somniferum TaxID=3469 RepID=UPI000E6F84B0|nr:basic 7S globulin-like [Papaver somniferum]